MPKTPKIFEPRWLLVIAFFIAGFFAGSIILYILFNVETVGIFKIHPTQTAFKYINPILAIEIYERKEFFPDKSLELELEGLIKQKKNHGLITDASIYFRDIEPGLWTGINEDAQFSPGKLLKIPIMIAYFKEAESDPDILNKELTFKGNSANVDEIFKPLEPLITGKSYTVNELIRQMIIFSDNDAANLLFDNINKGALDEIFSDLSITFKEDKENPDFISLKQYSLFFRILYNSTYLNREFSQKALELLVETDNSIGVGSGIPKNLEVANRYSARFLTEGGRKIFEMSECAIVYYPFHPYLLCTSAKGEDLTNVKNFFKDLGLKVYDEINFKYTH